jgi:RNA recognition motif-containing protein
MTDEAASKKAIAELDGATLENRTISVSVAKPKENKPSRGNGRSGFWK